MCRHLADQYLEATHSLNSMVHCEHIYPFRLFVQCARVYALLTDDTIVSYLVRIAEEAA
jgi:hypothetical protein